MKIFLSNVRGAALFYPDSKEVFGGSEVETYMLAKLFRDMGHHVTVLLGRKPENSADVVEGIHIRTLGSKGGRRLGSFWKQLNHCKPDLCFIKLISEYSALMGTWCRINNRAFIYRAANRRDLLLAKKEGNYGVLQRLFFFLTTSSSKLLLMQSKEQLTAFQNRFPHKNCIFEPNFQFPPSLSPLPYKDRDGILWVGHLTPVKSPDRLLLLAKLLPNVTFTVVAITSPTEYATQQEKALRSQHNVDFKGQVEYSQMGALFNEAKVLLNTSHSEGFPNTFLQALFAGTPLASLDINPNEILNASGPGLAIPNQKELAAFLKDLCNNSDTWADLHKNAILKSSTLNNVDAAKNRYESYINSCSACT